MAKQRESLVSVYRESKDESANSSLYVLTIVTTAFVPMQFFTGYWGMNFSGDESMEELKWKYGIVLFWGVVVVSETLIILLIWYCGCLNTTYFRTD